MRDVVITEHAPQAIGPYSQAIKAGGFVFVSGQIPIDPTTGLIVQAEVAAQTDRVLQNLRAILTAEKSDRAGADVAAHHLIISSPAPSAGLELRG